MIVIQMKVGELPRLVEIDGSLESMQEMVGGWIEHIHLNDGLDLVCNDTAKLTGEPMNFALATEDGVFDVICGDAFVCKAGRENFESIDLYEVVTFFEKFNGMVMML